MSYILDALRRAEAERQRGQVPGLGAGPTTALAAAPAAAGRRWLWVGLGASTLVLAGLAWLVLRPAAPNPSPTVALAPSTLAITEASPPAPVAPAAPAVPVLPVVVSAPGPAGPSPGPAQSPPLPAPAQAAPVAPPPVEPPAAQRSVKLAELTPQQRSEWPPLKLGGSVWSDNAASRFVILDGQVLREGQSVVPGLVLERIQPRSALLRWRGLLVELPL